MRIILLGPNLCEHNFEVVFAIKTVFAMSALLIKQEIYHQCEYNVYVFIFELISL